MLKVKDMARRLRLLMPGLNRCSYLSREMTGPKSVRIEQTGSRGRHDRSARYFTWPFVASLEVLDEQGLGAYHGRASFETFSHRKSVLKKPTWVSR